MCDARTRGGGVEYLRFMFYFNSDRFYHSTLLDQEPWIGHGFGTIHSTQTGYTGLKQIHSAICRQADGQRGEIGEGDALITTESENRIGVKTADCLPILIVDRKHRAVAAVHAGWRGTVAGIVQQTVAEMNRYHQSEPQDLVAAIGPGIGPCCFEVGTEVAQQFRIIFPEGGELRTIDLPEASRRQLLDSGVDSGRIDVAQLCTRCNPAQFHSFRRDRELAGRMVSVVEIRTQT